MRWAGQAPVMALVGGEAPADLSPATGGFLFLLFIVNFYELLIIDYSSFRLNPI